MALILIQGTQIYQSYRETSQRISCVCVHTTVSSKSDRNTVHTSVVQIGSGSINREMAVCAYICVRENNDQFIIKKNHRDSAYRTEFVLYRRLHSPCVRFTVKDFREGFPQLPPRSFRDWEIFCFDWLPFKRHSQRTRSDLVGGIWLYLTDSNHISLLNCRTILTVIENGTWTNLSH